LQPVQLLALLPLQLSLLLLLLLTELLQSQLFPV